MKIGVFDSGIGGKSVAAAIERALPEAEVLFVHDTSEHFPYGSKTTDEIYGFVVPIFQRLVDDGCDVIVVACNTVSTTLITRLRGAFSVPLIAVEPMVKTAATLTKSGVITVCATPTTLASERYAWLNASYGGTCAFIEPDCADWSALIEKNEMNEARLRRELDPALQNGTDVIVLGCTHYHWIEDEVRRIVGPEVQVLQPEPAVVSQLKRILHL